MNQKQLEIFTTLAQDLNFTRTAERLFLSQTTVTLQIKSLEEELGAQLFERTSRSVRLTYAGSVFLEGAVKILDQMQETVMKTAAAAKGYSGHIKIGFADDVNAAGLAKIVRKFSADHPEILLHARGGYPANLLNQLYAGEYDLIFTPSFHRLDEHRLNSHIIGSYNTIAAFHEDHRFSRLETLHYKDFENENFVCISEKTQELEFSSQFLQQLNLHGIHINIVARIDNIDTVFLMLDADLGITVLPDYFIGRFAGASQIRCRPIAEELRPVNFLAVWKRDLISWELRLFLENCGFTGSENGT